MRYFTFKTIDRLAGITPVPNIFIDEYLPDADGNFVKVYLTGLLDSLYGSEVAGESLSKKLGLLESDIIKAWQYWETKGLVKISYSDDNSMNIEFLSIPFSYDKQYKAIAMHKDKYSSDYLTSKMDDPNIKAMYDTIQELLGRMLTPKEIAQYLSWIDEFGFPPEVIIILIEYCKAKNKIDFRYIEKVAISWHDSNITTVADAQKYISSHEEKYNNYRLVLDFLGLKENELMKPQEELLEKWFYTWNFNLEMVLEACKICSLRINEPNFNYIDRILSNWHDSGFKSLKDIESSNSKKKTKNMKLKAPVTTFNSYDQRTYDVKELERKLLGRDGEIENEQ